MVSTWVGYPNENMTVTNTRGSCSTKLFTVVTNRDKEWHREKETTEQRQTQGQRKSEGDRDKGTKTGKQTKKD
jgi:hypothetical protein